MIRILPLLAGLMLGPLVCLGQNQNDPLRIAVIGVSHGHVGEVRAAAQRGEVKVVGIYEKDPEVRAASSLARMYPEVVFDDLEAMLDAVKPEAAMAYGSIYDHLSVVEACAPRGIHVMVEKPLAVSGEHARRMATLARRHGIHLLTNYETSWYPTNHRAREMVMNGDIGPVTRIEVYDGHRGPVEIGCGPEFLAWLTDPVLNGGGAVIDFGCYGANLATWLLGGQRPVSVSAVLKQLKPEVYPKVDDDATILVEYPGCTVQIMGSWCWPMDRKDMHIYGLGGYIYQDNRSKMRFMAGGKRDEATLDPLPAPGNNPFAYLTAVVRGRVAVAPDDLAALENNLTVVDILDAAKKSARTKKAVVF
jgi:predicted dehydrogenase